MPKAEAEGWDTYMERRLLDALFFDSSKSRKLELSSENKATVDVHWDMYTHNSLLSIILIGKGRNIHISVGFCVARS